MKIKKSPDSYDDYKVEMSFKELMALKAIGRESGDPVADECAKAIEWFFSQGDVPPPGASKEDSPTKGSEGDEIDQILPGADVAEPEAVEAAKVEVSAAPDVERPTESPDAGHDADEFLPRD